MTSRNPATTRHTQSAPLFPAFSDLAPAAGRVRPAHRAEGLRSPHIPRGRASGGALLLTTVLLLTGCSVPGMPGASGAPDSMVRAATVAEPDRAQGTTAADTASSTAVDDATGSSDNTASPDSGESDTEGAEGAEGAEDPAEPVWVVVPTDLDTGSASHTLSAASRNLVIDYWTDQDVSQLTPESTPIIRVSAHVDGADDGSAITVTRFNAQVQSLGVELANDTGSFAVNPPYAYTTGVALPANPTAHSTDLLVTFDLLTETAPGSGIFTRQTILDTVSLGYARPASSTDGVDRPR